MTLPHDTTVARWFEDIATRTRPPVPGLQSPTG